MMPAFALFILVAGAWTLGDSLRSQASRDPKRPSGNFDAGGLILNQRTAPKKLSLKPSSRPSHRRIRRAR